MYIVLRIVCFSGIEKDEVHQPYCKFVIANSIFISHRRSTSPVLSQDNWKAQLILKVVLLGELETKCGKVGKCDAAAMGPYDGLASSTSSTCPDESCDSAKS